MEKIETSKLEKLSKRTGIAMGDDMAEMLARYAEARSYCESWVGLDAPLLPAHPICSIQVQLVRWQQHNFGTPNPGLIANGIAEELGERFLALQLLVQEDIDDATGDIMVYCSQLATAHRLAFRSCIEAGAMGPEPFATSDIRPRDLSVIACGYLSHVQLKSAQGIRDMSLVDLSRFGTFVGISMMMRSLAKMSTRPIVEIFRDVSSRVLARDWVADKSKGGE